MSNLDPSWKKKIVYDIKHQDVYAVYEDLSGNTFDDKGRLINLEKMLNGPDEYDWDTPAQAVVCDVGQVKKEEGKQK